MRLCLCGISLIYFTSVWLFYVEIAESGFTYCGIFMNQRRSLLAFERLYADISGFGGNIYSDVDPSDPSRHASMGSVPTISAPLLLPQAEPGT